MKKTFLIFLLLLIVTGVWSTPKDLVLLLDTSQSFVREFNTTVTYFIEDIMSDYIAVGDSYHMLTFDSYTTVALDKKISESQDVADIINGLALIQPFGEYTDLIEALDKLYTHTMSIEGDGEKRIVILTDGRHDPPPGKYPADFDHEAEIDRLTRRLTDTGWSISVVPLDDGETREQELTSENSSEFFTEDQTDAQQLADQLGADTIDPNSEEGQMRAMGQIYLKLLKNRLSSKNQKVRLKYKVVNYREEPVEVNILGVLYNSADVLDSSVSFSLEPDEEDSFSLVLDFDGALTESNIKYPVSLFIRNDNVKPTDFDLEISYTPLSFVKHILPVILIIIAIIAVIFIIILAIRSRGGMSRRRSDEEKADYSLLGLKRESKKQQTKQRITPYDEKTDSIKGTKYYPEDNKTSKKVGKKPESTVAFTAAKPAGGKKIKEDKEQPGINRTAKEQEKAEREKEKIARMKFAKGEDVEIEDYPELKGKAHSKNIKFLLMLNVNHPFNFLAAARNAQRLVRGHELTMGSGNSSFYLYFSKMLPGPIATLRFNGDRCSFLPHDFQYFPNLNAPLEDCINKKIVVSFGGETQTITFKEWLSPLEEINRIMHMVEYLGPLKSPWDDDSKFE